MTDIETCPECDGLKIATHLYKDNEYESICRDCGAKWIDVEPDDLERFVGPVTWTDQK